MTVLEISFIYWANYIMKAEIISSNEAYTIAENKSVQHKTSGHATRTIRTQRDTTGRKRLANFRKVVRRSKTAAK